MAGDDDASTVHVGHRARGAGVPQVQAMVFVGGTTDVPGHTPVVLAGGGERPGDDDGVDVGTHEAGGQVDV